MPSAKHSVRIERPVADVFSYVIDGTRAQTWRPSVADIRLAGGAPGQVGARYEQGGIIKDGAKMINARAECVETRSAYKQALVRRRCIIPADAINALRGAMSDGGTALS